MGKPFLTHSAHPYSKMSFVAETDTSWIILQEPYERLRWARSRAFPTASAAARALAMEVNTYSAYEREPGASKRTSLTHDRAMQFARKFKVRWEWLLTGQGLPWNDSEDPEDAEREKSGHSKAIVEEVEWEKRRMTNGVARHPAVRLELLDAYWERRSADRA